MSIVAEQLLEDFKRLSPEERSEVEAAILALRADATSTSIDWTVSDIESIRTKKQRPYGLDAGKFVLSASFFDPLPQDILDAFEGTGNDPLLKRLQ